MKGGFGTAGQQYKGPTREEAATRLTVSIPTRNKIASKRREKLSKLSADFFSDITAGQAYNGSVVGGVYQKVKPCLLILWRL